jgi:hypothetical protein
VRRRPVQPIEWDGNSSPYTIGGNLSWANYTVSADALIQQAGAVQLIGRAGGQHSFGPASINEYYLQVSNTGAWSIVRNNTSDTLTTLASGTVAALGTGTWHHLALTLYGTAISAAIDGSTVGSVTDSTFPLGMVGLGTSGYQTDSVRQPVSDAGRLGGTDRPDRGGRRHGQVRRRRRRLRYPGHARADVGLQRRRQSAMAGSQRNPGQSGVGQVPGRPGLHHQ